MKNFTLSAKVTVGAFTIVTANSLEEAIEISKSRQVILAGYGGEDVKEQWVIEDADGEAFDIRKE